MYLVHAQSPFWKKNNPWSFFFFLEPPCTEHAWKQWCAWQKRKEVDKYRSAIAAWPDQVTASTDLGRSRFLVAISRNKPLRPSQMSSRISHSVLALGIEQYRPHDTVSETIKSTSTVEREFLHLNACVIRFADSGAGKTPRVPKDWGHHLRKNRFQVSW